MVSASGSVLPTQLIYNAKTKRCLPKYNFPDWSLTSNHWCNFEKLVSLFEKIIFPYLKTKKEGLAYPSSQKERELLVLPHNLAINFHSLDITVNLKAKKSTINSNSKISHKFNTCYGDRVSNQLKRGGASCIVRMSLEMSYLELLHTRWIVKMYDCLKQQKGLIINGFGKAGITEAIKSANEVIVRIENPFTEKRAL